MARTALTDGSGKWFDDKAAVSFDEGSDWNGNNHISKATGSQWNHERLYYTASGRWVLNTWSNYQNVRETYEEIDEESAVTWLCVNERFDVEELPPAVRSAVLDRVAALEL